MSQQILPIVYGALAGLAIQIGKRGSDRPQTSLTKPTQKVDEKANHK